MARAKGQSTDEIGHASWQRHTAVIVPGYGRRAHGPRAARPYSLHPRLPMNDVQRPDLDDEDTDTNSSANPSFASVIQDRVSRRQVLSGTAGAAAIAVLGGLKSETAAAHGSGLEDSIFRRGRTPQLNFAAVAKS